MLDILKVKGVALTEIWNRLRFSWFRYVFSLVMCEKTILRPCDCTYNIPEIPSQNIREKRKMKNAFFLKVNHLGRDPGGSPVRAKWQTSKPWDLLKIVRPKRSSMLDILKVKGVALTEIWNRLRFSWFRYVFSLVMCEKTILRPCDCTYNIPGIPSQNIRERRKMKRRVGSV